jgi:hypothetical protein
MREENCPAFAITVRVWRTACIPTLGAVYIQYVPDPIGVGHCCQANSSLRESVSARRGAWNPLPLQVRGGSSRADASKSS